MVDNRQPSTSPEVNGHGLVVTRRQFFALAGGTASYTNVQRVPYLKFNSANSHDVRSGSNGYCGGTIMCRAAAGYDGPTGLGTPNGVAGF